MTETSGSSVLVQLRQQALAIHSSGSLNLQQLIPVHTSFCNVFVQKPLDVSSAGDFGEDSSGLEIVISLLPAEDHDACLALLSSEIDADKLLVMQYMIHGLDPVESLGTVILPYLLHAKKISVELANALLDIVDWSSVAKVDDSSNIKKLEILKTCAESQDNLASKVLVRMFQKTPKDPLLVEALYSKLDQVIRAASKSDNQDLMTNLSKEILPSLTGPVNGKVVYSDIHSPKIGLLWQIIFSLYNGSSSEDEKCRSLLLMTAILCPLLPCIMKMELPMVDSNTQVGEGKKLPVEQPALWHVIFCCLSKGKSIIHKKRSEYALLRKRSLYLLDFLAEEGSTWKKYCMCFETMEMETETHLIDQIWETVAELLAEAAEPKDGLSNSTLTWEWMSLLLARGLSSDEPSMRKLVLYRLLKGRAGIIVPYIEESEQITQQQSSKNKKKAKEHPKKIGTSIDIISPDFVLEVLLPSWDSLCSSLGYTMHKEAERKIVKDPMTPYMIKFLEAHRSNLDMTNPDGRQLFWQTFWGSDIISKLHTKTVVFFFKTVANEDIGDYEVPASDSLLRSLVISLRSLFQERSVVRTYKEEILSALALILGHGKEFQTQWTPVTILQVLALFSHELFEIESDDWDAQTDVLFLSLQRFVQRLSTDGLTLGSAVASAYVRGDLIPTNSSWDILVGTSAEERDFAWSITLLCSLATNNLPSTENTKTAGELLWPAIHGGLSNSTAAAMEGNANAGKVERAILLLENGCKLRQISGIGNGDLISDRSGETVLPPPPNIEEQLLKAIEFLMYHIKALVAIGEATETGMIRTTGARRTMGMFAHLIEQVQVLHRSFPSSLSISQAAGKLLASSSESLTQTDIEDELRLQCCVIIFATLSSGAAPAEDSLISLSQLLLKQELSSKKGVSKTWKQAARSILQYARWGAISCIISTLVQTTSDDNREEMKSFFEDIFDTAFDAVEATPAEALVPLFNCIVFSARKWFSFTEGESEDALYTKSLQRMIKSLLALLQDCNKSNDSMYMLNEICSLLFSPKILFEEYKLLQKDPKYDAPIRGAFRTLIKLAGSQKPHIIKTVLSWITVGWLGTDTSDSSICGLSAIPFREDIVSLLIYKEAKIEEGSANQSKSQKVDGMLDIPPETDDLSIARAFVLVFLSKLPDVNNGLSSDIHNELLEPVILGLLKETAVQSGKKSQIMKGTPLYCLKMRGWQACCVMSRFVSSRIAKNACIAAYNALEEFLHGEVRYFVEIFIIQCGRSHPEVFAEKFCSEIRKVDLSLQHVSSLMVIGGNWIVGRYKIEYFTLKDDEHNMRLRKVIAGVLPWLSSTQGFSRAIAQMMIHELIPLVLDVTQQVDDFGSDWYLRENYKFLDENREMARLRKKQAGFFENYEVDDICTPEGVLSVPVDEGNEASPVNMVEIIKKTLVEVYEEAHDGQTPSWKHVETMIEMTASMDQVQVAEDNDGDNSTSLNFQRKIIPLDSLNLAMDDVRSRKLLNAAGRKRQGLIVCASLVDKAPNLAGLARTSEIFAVDKLVVPDINVTKMDNFKSISVGANEWITMEECKEVDLLNWLLEKKRTGHFVVGLEQTSSSVPLPKLKFPVDQPIVLLLGKEKEGIPVPLLQAVDQCVEIPQMGIIRSLNVHVSGAICIWEITKQRTLDGK